VPGSIEREIRDLRAVLFSDRDPDGRGFAPLADALRRAGDLAQALDVVQEGVGRLPDFATGHVVAGWVYRARDQGEEAERSFRRVLDLDDENISALKGLGLLLAERGDEEEALAHFRALDDLDPGDPEVRARLVELGGQDPRRSGSESGVKPSDRIVGIEELAPDSGESELVVDIADLAPDASSDAEIASPDVSGPVVGIGDLAPDSRASDAVVDIEDLAPEGYERPSPAAPEVAPMPEGPPPFTRPPMPEPTGRASGADDDGVEDEGPWTRTMAELYVRQGHPDRAIRIYRRLAGNDPDDASIATRLAELDTDPETVDIADARPGPIGVRDLEPEPEMEGKAEEGADPTVSEYLTTLLAWRPSPRSDGDDAS
jgi:tetratricopeptide (TPR) repeat protein